MFSLKLGLYVQSVLSVEFAVLLELKLTLGVPSVLFGNIILLTTFGTLQRNILNVSLF